MGKLIVLEGLDGCGKTTQYELLAKNLEKEEIDFKTVSFPNYDSESSSLVKMYLNGDFGTKPSDVNAYAASLFYAVDRYASFKGELGNYYDGGGNIIAARYVTSNVIHQTSKLPEEEWEGFSEWLYDLEYEKMGIPKPDLVIFLDVPVEISEKLLSGRYKGDETKKDIHERDEEYLNKCRKAARKAAEYSGWRTINCAKDGLLRSIEDISEEILSVVKSVIC